MQNFELLTVYARKEITTDYIAIEHGMKNKKDVCFYTDKLCTNRVARWSWHVSGIPTKRNKRVTLNCFTYNIEWTD